MYTQSKLKPHLLLLQTTKLLTSKQHPSLRAKEAHENKHFDVIDIKSTEVS